MASTKYKKISLLGMILLFTLTFPNDIMAKSDTSAKQAINVFYDAIINQNFGIAAEYYSLPIIGVESPYSKYKDIHSTAAYFDYLYPQEDYTLIEYEVVSFEEVDKDTFHGNIRMRGEGSNNPDGFYFYQDVLVTLEDNEWKLSIEDYVKYIQSSSLTKPIDELSERELISRFFSEMEKGNYGVAAGVASPKMSVLENEKTNAISAYLKEWNNTQRSSDIRITPGRLFILNEIPLQNDKTLYLISSDPYRNDKRLKTISLSLFENSDPHSNPAYQFIQIDHINGKSFINVADGFNSYNNEITSGGKKDIKSTVDTANSIFTSTVGIALAVLMAIVSLYWLISFVVGIFSSSVTDDRTFRTSTRERTYRESTHVDIEESVNQLLTKSDSNSNEEENEGQVHSKNQTRQIHISSEELDDNPVTLIPSSSKRKIHTDDE